jgi:hypothetical protein
VLWIDGSVEVVSHLRGQRLEVPHLGGKVAAQEEVPIFRGFLKELL